MPLTPTPHWLIPRPSLADGANIEQAVGPVANRVEALFDLALGAIIKVGMSIMWDGATDPTPDATGAVFLIRDGRLISKTTYLEYFTLIGHGANGGVDPGGGNFRIPDQRGRVSMMADASPAMGAANRISTFNRARFQSGGVERYPLTVAELAPHTHKLPQPDRTTADVSNNNAPTWRGSAGGPPDVFTESTGLGDPHNNMQPYNVDLWIVRVK